MPGILGSISHHGSGEVRSTGQPSETPGSEYSIGIGFLNILFVHLKRNSKKLLFLFLCQE